MTLENNDRAIRFGCYEVLMVSSPQTIQSLSEIPHQIVRYVNPEIQALSTGFIYVRKNPAFDGVVDHNQLRSDRDNPQFQEMLANYLYLNGVPLTDAVKAAGQLPMWHLDGDRFVNMGELHAGGQRVFCKLLLGPLATVTAYRSRNKPPLTSHIGLFGKWSNNEESGIWVMDAPRNAGHQGLLMPGDVEQLNADLNNAFLDRWPFFQEYALTDQRPTFEIKNAGELYKEFPGISLFSRDDQHQ